MDGHGWTVMRLRFVAEGAARATLLGFGTDVEVIGPETLRRSLADLARALLDLYNRPVTTSHPPPSGTSAS
jgi:predicted DNA-binding transcriptional regulator YafY